MNINHICVVKRSKRRYLIIACFALVTCSWPACDESALVMDEVEIVVQINGKVKDKMNVPADMTKEDLEKLALESEKVNELLEGKTIVKVIGVPGRLVNVVVR